MLRVTREYCGQETTIAAITALNSDGPREAATTIARMTVGNAMKRSVMRISVSSTQPPKYPATAPMTVPMIIAAITSISASGRLTVAPVISREKMSRPLPSVPSSVSMPGACRRGSTWALGPNGTHH